MRLAKRLASRPGDILAAFTRRVAEFGYEATNFSDIAAELGISKGTIVHHYKTKDSLLEALHESYMRRRLADAHRILDSFSRPDERLAGLLFAFVLYQVHDRDATVAFQREVARLRPPDRQSVGTGLRTEYLELVREVIRSGVADGSFRGGDHEVFSLLFFGSAQWAWTWFDPEGPKSAEQAGSVLVDLVLGSLLVDRAPLPRLRDDAGDIVRVVRDCLE